MDLFNNVGKKLQQVAKLALGVCIIFFVVIGLAVMMGGSSLYEYRETRGLGVIMNISGALILIVGPVLSWVGSLFIYALGILVQNSDETVKTDFELLAATNRVLETTESMYSREIPKEGSAENTTTFTVLNNKEKRCDYCGQVQSVYFNKCTNCKKKFIK